MKNFDLTHMAKYNPPSILLRLGKDWSGTVKDIVEHPEFLPEDRLMIILRSEMLSERGYREFALNRVLSHAESLMIPAGHDCLGAAMQFMDGAASEIHLTHMYVRAAVHPDFDKNPLYSAAVYTCYSPERAATAANLVSAFMINHAGADEEIPNQLEALILFT